MDSTLALNVLHIWHAACRRLPRPAQVPRAGRRAKPAAPAVTTMITAPSSPINASQLSPYLFTRPIYMDNTTLLAMLQQLVTENGTVNGHLFTRYGFVFGTAVGGGQNQYIERAFAGISVLNFLLPNVGGTSCAALARIILQESGERKRIRRAAWCPHVG